jgi:Sortilin, neurotensin receptor 3, C-terminal
MTWHTLKISDEPVEIRNIIIEPSNTAEKFIVYGRTTDSPRKGFMAAIDFTPLHQRWCTGIDKPDSPESDYETWTPNGFVSAHCLLGRRVNYIRKKRDAECFNSEEHERWSIQEYCECTEEDWECDFGFYRKELAGNCVSQDSKEVNTTAPEECPDYYYITQGYRKIAGDTCVGGVSHEPIKVSCPGTPLGRSNLLVFLLIVVIVLGLVWVNKKGNYDRLKDGFAEIVNTVLRSINRKSNPHSTSTGWVPIREFPDSANKDDDDLNHIVFEENEENPEVIEDNKLLEVAKGKKRAEGGLKAATKQVPLLTKPSNRKNESDLGV